MHLNLFLRRSSQLTQICRSFSSTTSLSVNKNALATLRKKTGYTFSNCKKALEQFGEDLSAAEKWLREQAQKEGWAKATMLQDRVVSQGLIGVKYSAEDGSGVLVEINCETDFVARNNKFHELVTSVAEACVRELEMKAVDGASYHKWSITPELLASFRAPQGGKTLGDLTALSIGTMGENIVLRRALLVKANPKECKISGYAHASDVTPTARGCYIGRYGALVIYRQLPSRTSSSTPPDESAPSDTVPETPDHLTFEDIGRQLGQHIVGMNPKSVGRIEDEPPAPAVVAVPATETGTEGSDDGEERPKKPFTDADDESRLIYQDFLVDPDYKVREVLELNNVEVMDFVRFELGGKMQEGQN